MAAAVLLASLAAVTLFPVRPVGTRTDALGSLCIVCGVRGSADALLNVVMFMPLGAIAFRLLGSVPRAGVAGFALSAAIELTQVAIPGRHATLGDVVWNGIGAIVGGALWVLLLRARSGRLAPAWRYLPAGVLGVSFLAYGWLAHASPTRDLYFGQWTPDLATTVPYDGALLSARLEGTVLPNGPYRGGVDLAEVMRGDWALETTLVVGAHQEGYSPIFAIQDAHEREVLFLATIRGDLLLRTRTRAYDLRFDRSSFVAPGAMLEPSPGDTIALDAWAAGDRRCLRVGEDEWCGSSAGFGRGWGLLLFPETAPAPLRRVVDFFWLVGLFGVVALAAGNGRRLSLGIGWVALCGVIAVVATPVAVPTVTEVLAMLAGLGLGRALGALIPG